MNNVQRNQRLGKIFAGVATAVALSINSAANAALAGPHDQQATTKRKSAHGRTAVAALSNQSMTQTNNFGNVQSFGGAGAPSMTTDMGDGIQMTQYPNNSGFQITSGNCSVVYDSRAKTMTMYDANGASQTVPFR